MMTMEEKRELLAKVLHAVTVGGFDMGTHMAMMLPSKLAVQLTRQHGATFVREDGKGYDLKDESLDRMWQDVIERAEAGDDGAIAVRDHSLREAGVLMDMLFDDSTVAAMLIAEVQA